LLNASRHHGLSRATGGFLVPTEF